MKLLFSGDLELFDSTPTERRVGHGCDCDREPYFGFTRPSGQNLGVGTTGKSNAHTGLCSQVLPHLC